MPRDGLLRSLLTVAVVAGLSNGSRIVTQGQSSAARAVLVTVEFRALQNGTPLFDLRPQDIALRADNVDRDLLALDLVRAGDDPSVIPAPFATNGARRRGRDLLFVVDEESYQPGGESRVREAVAAAFGRLTPIDRAGLVSLHASGVSVALTASPASLQAALRQIRGRAIGSESTTALSCRTRRQIPVMTSLFQGLDTSVTTTIVLLSAGLAAPQAATIVTPGIDRACQLTPEDFDEFRSAAAQSAAHLYCIHVGDGTGTGVDPRNGAGLERFAGEAGGQFLRPSGDSAPAMRRIVDDAGGFYVASFMIEPRPGRIAVDVRVRRDGATARYKRELVIPAVETKTVSTRDMIRTTSEFRALQLRAAAFASRDTDKTAKVVVLFEPAEAGVTLGSAIAGLFDAKGTLVAQWAPESQDLAARPVMAGLAVAPGAYRLRVAAVDSRGRSGAVDQDVAVGPFPAGSTTTSGVILGVQGAGTAPFVPRLQVTAADNVAHVYFEAYGAGPCAGLSATIEIAPAVHSPAIARSAAGASPLENSDGCILFGEFPVAALPPGDYAFRIRLQRGETVIGERLRSLRKTGL